MSQQNEWLAGSGDKGRLTRSWVNFWVCSEGVGQSLVIIHHAKSLQVPIFQDFDDIYKPKALKL